MNDADAGIAEMRRVVRPGGVVAVCMWDRAGMDMLAAVQRTQQAVPGAAGPTEARTLYRTREELESLFASDGFADVATELIEVARDSEDAPFRQDPSPVSIPYRAWAPM